MLTGPEIKSVIKALQDNARATNRLAKAQEEANKIMVDIAREGMKLEGETRPDPVVHFCAYGSYTTACGIETKGTATTLSDYWEKVTCAACVTVVGLNRG